MDVTSTSPAWYEAASTAGWIVPIPNQRQMDAERVRKEKAGVPFTDVDIGHARTVRVFRDGHSYQLTDFGGKWVKSTEYSGTTSWDMFDPCASVPVSGAIPECAQQNRVMTDTWAALQGRRR